MTSKVKVFTLTHPILTNPLLIMDWMKSIFGLSHSLAITSWWLRINISEILGMPLNHFIYQSGVKSFSLHHSIRKKSSLNWWDIGQSDFTLKPSRWDRLQSIDLAIETKSKSSKKKLKTILPGLKNKSNMKVLRIFTLQIINLDKRDSTLQTNRKMKHSSDTNNLLRNITMPHHL